MLAQLHTPATVSQQGNLREHGGGNGCQAEFWRRRATGCSLRRQWRALKPPQRQPHPWLLLVLGVGWRVVIMNRNLHAAGRVFLVWTAHAGWDASLFSGLALQPCVWEVAGICMCLMIVCSERQDTCDWVGCGY